MKDGKFEVGDRVRVVNALSAYIYQDGDDGLVTAVNADVLTVLFEGPHGVNGGAQKTETFLLLVGEVEFIQQPAASPVTPEVKPSKPTRVRAYKEDYIQRATLAEMRVHQLEVDLNKAVDEAVDLRSATELAAKELVRLTDHINDMRADFLTQKTIAEKYRQLYDGLTVWQAIKRAVRKAVRK